MGLLNYIKKKTRARAAKFFGFGEGRNWVTLAGENKREELHGGFADATVRAIVNGACNGELQLKQADGSVIEYKRKGENLLLDLLYQPTPYFNENIFKQIVVSQFLVYGNVFIFKDARDSQGRPTRLIPIPKPCVFPLLDPYGYPYAYRINTINGGFNVPREDIIHVYEGNASELFWGQSRFLKCALDNDTMNAAKVFNLNFFRNGASVGGVIEYPTESGVTQQEADEAVRMFNDRHQGEMKSHRWTALTNGGQIKDFKSSHKDMEFAQGQRFAMQQIYSQMGVPPAMVGLFEHAPQFNTKEQQKMFYETNVMPLMRLFADAFSEELVPEFYKDESVYVWYDFGKVKALEPDWEAKGRAVQLLAPYYPINEITKVLDLPFSALPGGDEPPSPILSAFGLEAPKADKKSVKRVRTIRPTPAQMKRHKSQKAQLIEQQGEVMRKSIESHFKMQSDLVLNWVAENEDTLFDYNACFGSRKTQEEALLVVKIPAMAEIFQAAVSFEQAYLQSLAPKKDYKFISKKAMQDRVQKWAEEHALLWAGSIEETTLKRIDEIVKVGVSNGMPNKQINNIILQFFSEEGYEPTMLTQNVSGAKVSIFDRVGTIVQTETRSTISEAQLETYRSTPYVTGKGWITTMGIADHHKGHLEMDGQEVRMDEKFYNKEAGMYTDAPGQFGVADQDINCLCDTYPVVLDEE